MWLMTTNDHLDTFQALSHLRMELINIILYQ